MVPVGHFARAALKEDRNSTNSEQTPGMSRLLSAERSPELRRMRAKVLSES
jgi:hypothetical protein